MTTVVKANSIKKLCDARPAEWEATTDDGRHVYIRYRWGLLIWGIGSILDEAVLDADNNSIPYGDSRSGEMTDIEMKNVLSGALQFI